MKIKYEDNQTLDQKVVILLWTKIILPMREFITLVLMNSPLGNFIHLDGGILMGIQRKLWVAMLIYAIIWHFSSYGLFIINPMS